MKVIGRIEGLNGYALEKAEALIGCEFGEALIGLFLLNAVDGLVLEDGGETWVLSRGEKRPFDTSGGGWTDQVSGFKAETISARDWREAIQAEGKWFAQFLARYGGEA